MKTYSIEDLLVGQTYVPRSLARRFQGGEITFAEKREDIWLDGYDAYAIRYRVGQMMNIVSAVAYYGPDILPN